MTALLLSVRSADEATLALDAGVDIVDIKEPNAGALGAVPLADVRRIVPAVHARGIQCSATVGDLAGDSPALVPAIDAVHACGVDIVKVGIFDMSSGFRVFRRLLPLAQNGIRLIVVLFADKLGSPVELLNEARECELFGVMVDTADKNRGRLTTIMPHDALQQFADSARRLNLVVGFAGSLRSEDVSPLLSTGVDYLGFRGAACSDAARVNTLDAVRVATLRRQIPKVDFRQRLVAGGIGGPTFRGKYYELASK